MNKSQHLGDDLLNAWIDDSANAPEHCIIKEHLGQCVSCRNDLDALRSVKVALSRLPHPPIPRSFQLTPEQARKRRLIGPKSSLPPVVSLLPVVRMLGIAAVIVFMVLGGSLPLGPVSGTLTDDSDQSMMPSETDERGDASQRQRSNAPMAAAPGEVVDRGDTASSQSSISDALSEEAASANGQALSAPESDGGFTALELATMTAAGLAVVLLGVWVYLNRMSHQ